MGPKPKFQEGERVLCFHGPLLYEAKCVKHEIKDKQIRYMIHYNGWNKNWDEWVPESRVLKANEQGYQKQKELQKAFKESSASRRPPAKGVKKQEKDKDERSSTPTNEKPKQKEKEEKQTPIPPPGKGKHKDADKDRSSRSSTPTGSTSVKSKQQRDTEKDVSSRASTPTITGTKSKTRDKGGGSSASSSASQEPVTSTPPLQAVPIQATSSEIKRKRTRPDPTVESEETYLTKMDVKVKIPDELKPWLVDDWDLVTKQKMLVTLPCKSTVDMILEEYIKFKLSKGNASCKDAIIEVTEGVKDYFNVMLGTQLLYKFERPQYAEILAEHPEKTMSSIYGATHLLRLFVKLGSMLAYTTLDEKSTQSLLNHIHDILKYFQKNSSTLFLMSDYFLAPPDYHRKAI
ncbi:hypothetical protein CHS0354_030036 [Potamilus streckersoni]|uniref:Mortality factor 4-like protein 1 n=1 Tax=Potamilus streckersoni TaxID=2493646 RepID=A0AAE0TIN9_9BIVA|nr:hypothetical protein CHS0354_030036 [Potamilus streckersoni]